MDGKKFDSLSKSIGRRGAMKGIAAGGLALAGAIGFKKSLSASPSETGDTLIPMGEFDQVSGEGVEPESNGRYCVKSLRCMNDKKYACRQLIRQYLNQNGARKCDYRGYRCYYLDAQNHVVCDQTSLTCKSWTEAC